MTVQTASTSRPWRSRGEAVRDVMLAVVVFAASLALLAARSEADTRSLDALGVPLAAFASLPLAAWRRSPLAVFVVTAAASSVLNALGYPPGPPLGPTVALFLLALSPEKTRVPRWAAGVAVASLFVLHVGGVALAD